MTPEIKQGLIQLANSIRNLGRPLTPEERAAVQETVNRIATRVKGGGQQPLPEEDLKMLWFLAKGDPGAFVAYLNTIPDPALKNIAQNRQQIEQIVRNFQQQYPSGGEVPPLGDLSQSPLQSSNVQGFRYDPRHARLLVKFQRDGVYSYENVPEYIYSLFRNGSAVCKTSGQNEYGRWWKGKSPSIGAALFNYIKQSGYPYQKVA